MPSTWGRLSFVVTKIPRLFAIVSSGGVKRYAGKWFRADRSG